MTVIKGTSLRITRLDEVGNPLSILQKNDVIIYTPPAEVAPPFAALVAEITSDGYVNFWRWCEDGDWACVQGNIEQCEVIGSLEGVVDELWTFAY